MLDNNKISIKNTEKTGNTYETASTFAYENISCYLIKEDYKSVGLLDEQNMHNTYFCQINRYLSGIKRGQVVYDKNNNEYYIDGLIKFEEDNYMELTLIMKAEWQDSK